MKNLLSLIFLSLLMIDTLPAQNEFGAVGSFWRYDFEPHDGNGSGWEILSIEADTLIDGALHKKLYRTYYNRQNLPPFEVNQNSGFIGTIQFVNDSVFWNSELLFTFKMSFDDTLLLQNVGTEHISMQLSIDSIGEETIDGIFYKKWYGQKNCLIQGFPDPYESFELLEHIGPIALNYLLWNTDGCTIGGGRSNFNCYKNGNFTYPPGVDCQRSFLSHQKELQPKTNLKIYPNPAQDFLQIESDSESIEMISITDVAGKIVANTVAPAQKYSIDLSSLSNGLYFVQVKQAGKMSLHKFFKM